MKEEKTIKLKISYQSDRENLITALATNGYKVWVEQTYDDVLAETAYFVCFLV